MAHNLGRIKKVDQGYFYGTEGVAKLSSQAWVPTFYKETIHHHQQQQQFDVTKVTHHCGLVPFRPTLYVPLVKI